MAQYKLCYFEARGLGEMCRVLFAEAEVKYDDVRYSSEKWPEHKPTMKFGQMPVLFVDGVQIAHSRAIVRYLAREFGLNGENSLEAAQIDTWIEVLFETYAKLPFFEKDEKVVAEAMKNAMDETLGPKFKILEKDINSTEGPYILKNFSAGDVAAYVATDILIKRFKVDLSCFPAIVKLLDAVAKRPNIKKWIETRPETEN